MPEKKRKRDSKAIFKLFWEHTKMHPWLFSIAVFGGVLSQVMGIVSPLFTKQIFDLLATTNPQTVALSAFLVPLGWYALTRLISWTADRITIWFGYVLVTTVQNDFTKLAFGKLIRHSHRFFASSFSGALTRRVTRFASSYESLYYAVVDNLAQSTLYIFGVIVVLSLHNIYLGIIVLFWVICFTLLQWLLSKLQQKERLIRSEQDSALSAALSDSISNQNTVALFSAAKFEEGTVGGAADKLMATMRRLANLDTFVTGVQGLLAVGLNVGLLYLGIKLWHDGTLSLGTLVLMQAYIFGIFGDVWRFGRQFRIINVAIADATEMAGDIRTPYEVADKKNAKKLKVIKGEVRFDDVSFSFADGAQILKDFNLTIVPGEKIGLVGPSGAGKTTVTKLLLRLYDVKKGGIHIDGQNISDVTQDSLRDAIGFVPQEPILFHRSLMENIRYGRRDATDAEVVEAAKKAHCHEFISELKLGYDTFVGERGIKLSGGERQRVAIARAILKDAPLLVLDEATSSLDSESEALIQEALEVLMKGKTVVVIAHRLSTIMKMDRIVVMQAGDIVAEGTHLELVNQKGLYQKLWSIQAGGFLQEDAETVE